MILDEDDNDVEVAKAAERRVWVLYCKLYTFDDGIVTLVILMASKSDECVVHNAAGTSTFLLE